MVTASNKKRTGAYQMVREHVVRHYSAGDRLPGEEELAKKLRISRYAVLRGLTELSDSGVIRRDRGRGSVVLADGETLRAKTNLKVVAYIADEFNSHLTAQILRGIDEFFRGKFATALLNSNHDAGLEMANIEGVTKSGYLAVIGILSNNPAAIRAAQQVVDQGVPFVQVDRHHEELHCPWVESDHEQGAYEAVTHLIRLGHRRIGHIGLGNLESSLARERGYRRALTEAGIAVREEYIQRPASFEVFQPMPAHVVRMLAYEPMHKLLMLPEKPTAVFLLNDCLAAGALAAVMNHGLSVPADMSLVGFDDGPEARQLDVPLTTVAQPFRRIGYCAAELAQKLINKEPIETPGIKIPTRLELRASTQAPRSNE